MLLLLHRAVNMVHRFLIDTPLNPSRLPIRGVHHPTLVETWSQHGLVVNTLRTRGDGVAGLSSPRLASLGLLLVFALGSWLLACGGS